MDKLRALIYKLGYRPKIGSIFYSPTKDLEAAARHYMALLFVVDNFAALEAEAYRQIEEIMKETKNGS